MNENCILETERLILRKVVQADFELMHHLDVDPIVKKYIGPPLNEDEIKERFGACLTQHPKGKGFGKFIATTKVTQEDIGWYVLAPLDNTEEIEIGYRLKEVHWGKGYATEMSHKLLNYGFKALGLERIVGVTHLENQGSKNVLLKIGLKYVGQRFYYKTDVDYFAIDKTEYEALIQI